MGKVMRVELERLESTNQNLRTNVVEGAAMLLPEVGKPFTMIAEPLDPTKDVRVVSTSIVTEVGPLAKIDSTDRYYFKTLNSTYSLTVLK